jgi:hypothetical protein
MSLDCMVFKVASNSCYPYQTVRRSDQTLTKLPDHLNEAMSACEEPAYRSGRSIFPKGLFSGTWKEKPSFHITVDREDRRYNTLDHIQGHIAIVCPVDTPFEDLSIEFIGETRTNIDHISTPTGVPSFAVGYHKFLRLEQPNVLREWRNERVFRAKQLYFFHFDFVLPKFLLPGTCRHPVIKEGVRHAHLVLPPSLGYETKGDVGSRDVLSDMVSIQYKICTSFRYITHDHREARSTASHSMIVHVVPTIQTRLDCSLLSFDWSQKTSTAGSTTLRTVPFHTSHDRISFRSLHSHEVCYLDNSSNFGGGGLSMILHLEIRFESSQPCAIPTKIQGLDVKLQARTSMACSPFHDYATDDDLLRHDLSKRIHYRTITLTSEHVRDTSWTRVPSYEGNNVSVCQHSTSYITGILLPVVIPEDVAHVPSFQSCLVGRQYSMSVRLLVGQFPWVTSVEIGIPLLILSEHLASSTDLPLGHTTEEECLPSYETKHDDMRSDIGARHIWRGM